MLEKKMFCTKCFRMFRLKLFHQKCNVYEYKKMGRDYGLFCCISIDIHIWPNSFIVTHGFFCHSLAALCLLMNYHNRDPIVWLDGTSPANTCILTCSGGSHSHVTLNFSLLS
jgi:hypothetical protein